MRKSAQPFFAFGFGPRLDGAFVQRQSAIGNNQIERIIDGVAESLAARTGPDRAVEAEQNRLRLAEFQVVVLAHEALTEEVAFARARVVEDRIARFAIADFDRIDDALVQIGRDRYPVGEHINGLLPIDIEQRFGRREFENHAVLPEPVEAPRAQFGQHQFGDLALPRV